MLITLNILSRLYKVLCTLSVFETALHVTSYRLICDICLNALVTECMAFQRIYELETECKAFLICDIRHYM